VLVTWPKVKARRAKTPVIILNLTPGEAIDYAPLNQMRDRAEMTGEWLAWCQSCSVPEIANVFNRARMSFFQITGTLQDDDIAWREIDEWVDAARGASVMEHNRLGLMVHYYGGMLDTYSDRGFTLSSTMTGGNRRSKSRSRVSGSTSGDLLPERFDQCDGRSFRVWPAKSPVRAVNTNVGVLILLPPSCTQATW
jgi:hypothetical protein